MNRYGDYKRNGFDFGDFVITKREIIVSISIIAIMLLFGVLISGKISEHQMDKNEVYNKAVKIENTDLFQYGMDTNVGNAFVYGELQAVDKVTYPEIGGEYMYIEKIEERYTRHTRTVYEYDDEGNVVGQHEEEYWTWDRVGSEELMSKEVSFCGVKFSIKKIDIPSSDYIKTIKESRNTRYKYYGTGTKFTGTIFTVLKDKTIPDGTDFYNGYNIEQTVSRLESGGGVIFFWIIWILLIAGAVFAFFYYENKWLE